MSTTEKQQRRNRTVVLPLGNTLDEYNELISTDEGLDRLVRRVEIADCFDWGPLGSEHEENCSRQHQYTHHGSYERRLKHYSGEWSNVTIMRVRCLDCDAAFSVLPAFVGRYQRSDMDAIEKVMVQLFITEDSYRMTEVGQALGMGRQYAGTWAALETVRGEAIAPMAAWRLVQWVGQLSPTQLNLALGVKPPKYILSDEKHTKENGERTYVPMIYDFQTALIWWIDYVDSVSEPAMRASLERFKAIDERLGHITGATVDGWNPTQEALKAVFPGITLGECHLHALMKLGTHVATYKRQRKAADRPVSETEESQIRTAFVRVLTAPTPEAYQEALDQLPEAFNCEPLASRKRSLKKKQPLFQAWTKDGNLARFSTDLDQCMTPLKKGYLTTETQRTRRKFIVWFKRIPLYTSKSSFFQGQV